MRQKSRVRPSSTASIPHHGVDAPSEAGGTSGVRAGAASGGGTGSGAGGGSDVALASGSAGGSSGGGAGSDAGAGCGEFSGGAVGEPPDVSSLIVDVLVLAFSEVVGGDSPDSVDVALELPPTLGAEAAAAG